MNIAEWTIRNRVTSLTIFALIIVAGIMTFRNIPRQEDPDFIIRTAMITTVFPGASPQKVEELVTDKLEEKIREMAEVETVTSESLSGLSLISVDVYESIKDVTPIWTKLRNKVDDAMPDLPAEAGKPMVNDEFGDVFGFLIAVTGDGYSYREVEDYADMVRNKLMTVDGIAKVDRWGRQEERVFIEFSNARFAELGLSPFMLQSIIRAQNTIQPSGQIFANPERINLRASGEFNSVDDIRNMNLRKPGGKDSIALEDVTTIHRGFKEPPSTMVRYNGQDCILLAVSMAVGNNISEVGQRLRDKSDEVLASLPVGIGLDYVIYTPDYVDEAVDGFVINLGQSFIFVVAVMLLFAGLRVGLICGALVPMAMLACIAFMPMFDVFLQRISIASMIIALGILVDNGVVVSENILVQLEAGADRMTAVKRTVSELSFPLLAASLTTIFAFLPIPLAPSSAGEYCVSLFIVITITLLASWLLSMTMVPMMCYGLLKPQPSEQTFSGRIYRTYRSLLTAALKQRTVFMGIILILCALSFWGFRFVPKIFFPPNERAQFMIDFWLPYGTDIRVTSERSAKLEEFLQKDPAFESMVTFIGAGGPRWYLPLDLEQNNENLTTFVVNIDDFDSLPGIMDRTEAELQAHYPDLRYRLKEMMLGPPSGAAIEIRISGDDMTTLYRLRDNIADLLHKQDSVVSVWDDWGNFTKQMVVQVDQNRARRAGLTSADIASSIQMQMSELQVSDFREGDKVIPIVLRTNRNYRDQLDKLLAINVYSSEDNISAPLLQVADIIPEWQPADVRRRDQVRTMTVQADVEGEFASEVLARVKPEIEKLMDSGEWPAGYTLEYGGSDEKSAESQAALMENMPLAMGLLILILVIQFNSIKKPMIIMLTLPPMMLGITPGMVLTQSPFGFMPMLGMISLLGIIVNNAIMLLDRMDLLQKDGMSLADSVVVAALQRSRPIIMTTVTTIIGLAPLIYSGGGMWRPMAILMASGLAGATVLTLLLCPVLYSLFYKVRFKDWRWDPAILESVK
ncbi:efflux RND transporter permease subunit [Pseudodesulfovibrio senegalensis]|uniref:Efflux RND transporter permease subunit n=1 Tax=Pseudodesulfovibrio senegalensis TaxID=1721087 RepID=A0A6N6MXB4_9BACT|nr:efflux RND transporter permease subunit [Pseudodesulfovibrio senegalensis]KAB1437212.1 efflux RND transporter permease subunit [Pseudodesulfovibrio senegalensis]